MIRSQNAKIKNKINIHFAFSERPDPHQLKFVQFFSTQPISNYFTLQGYIPLVITAYLSGVSTYVFVFHFKEYLYSYSKNKANFESFL